MAPRKINGPNSPSAQPITIGPEQPPTQVRTQAPASQATRAPPAVCTKASTFDEGGKKRLLDRVQLGLDAGGLVPLLNVPASLLNAGVSAARGDKLGTTLNLAAAVPVAGSFVKGGRLAVTAARVARTADAAEDVAKLGNTAGRSATRASRAATTAASAERVIGGMSPNVSRGMETLFKEGPNRWVGLGQKAEGGTAFQRGLSGDFTKGAGAGVDEAMGVLTGKADDSKRFVSTFKSEAESLELARTTNSQYARPLTVRGRANDLIDGRSLPEGAHLAKLESVGLFTPPNADGAYDWAQSTLKLRDELVAGGMRLDPGSRGGRFLRQVEDVMAKRRYGEFDGFGQPLLNQSEISQALAETFARFR
jgi:hypothetical protein